MGTRARLMPSRGLDDEATVDAREPARARVERASARVTLGITTTLVRLLFNPRKTRGEERVDIDPSNPLDPLRTSSSLPDDHRETCSPARVSLFADPRSNRSRRIAAISHPCPRICA